MPNYNINWRGYPHRRLPNAFELHHPVGPLSGVVGSLALLLQTAFDDHWELSSSDSERNRDSHFDDVNHESHAVLLLLLELGNTLLSGPGNTYRYLDGTQILLAKPIHYILSRYHLKSKRGRGLDLQQLQRVRKIPSRRPLSSIRMTVLAVPPSDARKPSDRRICIP